MATAMCQMVRDARRTALRAARNALLTMRERGMPLGSVEILILNFARSFQNRPEFRAYLLKLLDRRRLS
jgi:hypothetical protein